MDYPDNKSRFEAVCNRDKQAIGCFYYAVESTGVYCKPACASRLPKPENVRFYDSCAEAELAGFRACKRCKPNAQTAEKGLSGMIVDACRQIEETDSDTKLKSLAECFGLSPSHFHKVFKEIVGITPKQYAAALQSRRFRDNLKTTRSITEAIYESGFSSSSRAYEKVRERLAMTPKNYQKGGSGELILYGVAPCFLGWMIVAVTIRGICMIELGDGPEELTGKLHTAFPRAEIELAGEDFEAFILGVADSIRNPESHAALPLDIQGTAFQEQVWKTLMEIPAGTTLSYSELAEKMGKPRAVRAVASACGANRLAVVIPCHRILCNDGDLGGYRWGLERKKILLLRERSGNRIE